MSKKYDRINERVGRLEKKIFGFATWQCRLPNPTETAEECRCPDLCYIHCRHYERFPVTPDLPLRVRVAKALGDEVQYWPESRHSHAGWFRVKSKDKDKPFVLQAWESIPDYPNDLVAAMGALEEFRGAWQLNIYGGGSIEITIGIHDAKTYCFDRSKTPLPQAICEAICAHAEGK